MFTQNFNIKRLIPLTYLGILTLLLTSCGAHNQGYNQNDGIYSSSNNVTSEEGEENENPNERSNYYKHLL